MNQTAADCLAQSAHATTTSQRDALISMSQEYCKMAETYKNQSSDTQQLADNLSADLVKLEVKMQDQGCVVKTTSVMSRSASKGAEEDATTEFLTTLVSTFSTTSTTSKPAFDLNGKADFGFISRIVLEIAEDMFNEAFGGLTIDQIFTSIFSGTQICGETFVANSSIAAIPFL